MKKMTLMFLMIFTTSVFANSFDIIIADKEYCAVEKAMGLPETLFGQLTIKFFALDLDPEDFGIEYLESKDILGDCHVPLFKVKVRSCIKSTDITIGQTYQFELEEGLEKAITESSASPLVNHHLSLYKVNKEELKDTDGETPKYRIDVFDKALVSEKNFECAEVVKSKSAFE